MSGRACRRHGAVPRSYCDGCRMTGLRRDLDEAIDLTAEALGYVPEYFRWKWSLDDRLAELRRRYGAVTDPGSQREPSGPGEPA